MSASESSELAPLVRHFRLVSGLSQEALAERSGLSARQISDLERGLRKIPRLETIRMLATGPSLSDEARAELLAAAPPELRTPFERRSTDSFPMVSDTATVDAIEYLRAFQGADRGFGYSPGAPADANSTAFAVSALTAAGEDPQSEEWRNAAAVLLSFQNASGAFRYDAQTMNDDILATIAAPLALSGAAEPVFPAV